MEDLLETVTAGNVVEVKVVLTSVVTALALYQVFLMSVGYGKLSLTSLSPPAASAAHRAVGDTIVVVTLVVGIMCLGYFGIEDDAMFHVVSGWLLAAAIAFKIVVVRWWHSMSRLLPLLGLTVLSLFLLTWWSSAGSFFWG